MNDAQLIDKLGGVTAVARLLGIAPSSVSGWKAIPLDRKIRLAVIAEDLGLTTRKELFLITIKIFGLNFVPRRQKQNLGSLTA